MKYILILFFSISSLILYSQSNDSLFKKIDWLKSNYPDKEWIKVSSSVIAGIFSMNKDYNIYVDPIDSLTHEISTYAHIFVKIYTFGCYEFYNQHPGKKNSLQATLHGFDCIIKYYSFITEKDSTYKSNAIEYYKNLQSNNKLKDFVISRTKYLKKDRPR
jgi:hypothetical protein